MEQKLSINQTEFGSITIDGQAYEHDVVIRLSGKVATPILVGRVCNLVHRSRPGKTEVSLPK
jgi:hypothetical protein